MPNVPHRSSLPGVRYRGFRGPADYAALAAVRAGCAIRDRVDPLSARERVPTAADFAAQFGGVQPGSPNLLLAEAPAGVVGYAQCSGWSEEGDLWVGLHLGWVLPAWRGRGIGHVLLGWAQERLRAVAAVAAPGARAVFATNVSSTALETDRLIRVAGYHVERVLSDMRFVAWDALPAAALPPGVAVRPVTAADLPAIYAAYKDTWAGMWGTAPASDADYAEFLDDNARGPGADLALWRVAWAGDAVVGLVTACVRDTAALIPEVGVRPAWRRRGIARGLLVEALAGLRSRGLQEARLVTDADNAQGARTLYESVGFAEVKQHRLYRRAMEEGGRDG